MQRQAQLEAAGQEPLAPPRAQPAAQAEEARPAARGVLAVLLAVLLARLAELGALGLRREALAALAGGPGAQRELAPGAQREAAPAAWRELGLPGGPAVPSALWSVVLRPATLVTSA